MASHNLDESDCIEWTLFNHSTIILLSSKGHSRVTKWDASSICARSSFGTHCSILAQNCGLMRVSFPVVIIKLGCCTLRPDILQFHCQSFSMVLYQFKGPLNPVLEYISAKYFRSSSERIQLLSILSDTPTKSPPLSKTSAVRNLSISTALLIIRMKDLWMSFWSSFSATPSLWK